MALKNGRTLVISISNDDSPETWTAVAGAQEKSFTITNGEITTTNDDDAGKVTRLGGGNQDFTMSVSGVEDDEVLLALAADNTKKRLQVEYTDTNATIAGEFEIGSYEVTGVTDNGAITFTCSLRTTAGDWTYTAGS